MYLKSKCIRDGNSPDSRHSTEGEGVTRSCDSRREGGGRSESGIVLFFGFFILHSLPSIALVSWPSQNGMQNARSTDYFYCPASDPDLSCTFMFLRLLNYDIKYNFIMYQCR